MRSISGINKKYFVLGGIVLSFLLFFAAYSVYTLKSDRIHKGIYAGSVDISGLTRQQAIAKVNNNLKKVNTDYLGLKYSDKQWQIDFSQISAKFNVEQAVDKAYSIGRTGNVFARMMDVISARRGKKFDIVFDYNKDLLYNKIIDISKEMDIPKKNAKIIPGQHSGTIVPGVIGTKLDIEKTFQLADEHISKFSNDIIELPIAQDLPTINEQDLKNMTTEISTYSTNFNPNDVPRTNNIKVACSRIDGTILKPNEVFSTDDKILDRTPNNGYQIAKAFFQNEVVDEVGGGICQVATTLYDTVLTANLEVIERQQHSMSVDYVNPGFDAAISAKGVDLKFKNTLGFPIYIYSSVAGNSLTMKIFGKSVEPGQRIQLESEVTDIFYPGPEQVVYDTSLPTGTRKVAQKSKNGYKAKLYKTIYKNGVLTSREMVAESLYQPSRGKIKVGG